MKKLGYFKSSLLMSAVAFSLLSSPANAVSEEVARAYWNDNSTEDDQGLYSDTLEKLIKLDDVQWDQFKEIIQSLMTSNLTQWHRQRLIKSLAKISPEKWSQFLSTAKPFIIENEEGYSRCQATEAFGNVSPEKWTELVATAQSLMTEDMQLYNKAFVVAVLGKVNPEKWPEFVSIATSLMTKYMNASDRLQEIETLAKVIPEKWTEFVKTAKSLITSDYMNMHYHTNVIKALGKVNSEKWTEFVSIATHLITKDMYGDKRALVIEALGNVSPEKWPEFVLNVQSFMKARMTGDNLAQTIEALGGVIPEKWAEFILVSNSLITREMSENDEVKAIKALRKVNPEKWTEFIATVKSLITKKMYGREHASVIEVLSNVQKSKTDRVYSQIQRLMRETQGKIQFARSDAAVELIKKLGDTRTDEEAIAFTTVLVQLVNLNQGNVDDNALLTHINTAWGRVRGATSNELQELARQRQSTHKKEVHASVAASVEKLKKRYAEKLPEGDIFELVQALFMSVFANDMQERLNEAVTAAKALVDSQAIDNLLQISPHTRAGEGGADTALNVAARRLWEGKSEDARKAIQDVVTLHSQQNNLSDVVKLLDILKSNPDFKDGLSQIGYEELLRLIYTAITDDSWGQEKDMPDRWQSLMIRMVRAKNEYRPGDEACAAGTFNALLEPLSSVHPDVLIIPSFRLMMEEIALEKEDREFERRVHVSLAYLGPDARKDQEYMQVLADVTDARLERQNQDTKDLQQFGETLGSFKDLSDEDFETKAAELISGLSPSAKKEGAEMLETNRQIRATAKFKNEMKSFSDLSSKDFETQGRALLASYPDAYRDHLETHVLKKMLQNKQVAEENQVQPRGLGSSPTAEQED